MGARNQAVLSRRLDEITDIHPAGTRTVPELVQIMADVLNALGIHALAHGKNVTFPGDGLGPEDEMFVDLIMAIVEKRFPRREAD
ncbi:hypothetical protein [Brevibacterium litoralis]|uniref:hypothetical protein n=1 Tax=Brevibacterium litoralis TaxID=3138935 RepID=UPI0032EF24D6